ncbi:MAG: phage tail protein [Saprospiraceae bacterium]|nr:phage tail protein [Saprospiraceae bacterium]
MDPFVAEIRIMANNFAPTGWAFCAGQILPLSQNTALFSLLGTTYGGNGKSTFALPDMQGNAPMFWGQGPGLSLRDLGEMGGVQSVTLLESEIPSHNHNVMTVNDTGDTNQPANNGVARSSGASVFGSAGGTVTMGLNSIAVTGSSFPHNNMQPYLVLNFVIALQGVYPPRT